MADRISQSGGSSTPGDGSHVQAGTVPFRVRDGHVEFCLVTALRTGQWGFPKGHIDPGEDAVVAACRETWEEAGVRGDIVGEIAGYRYARHDTPFVVRMYLLRVVHEANDWDERGVRQRAWARVEDARARIDRSELHPVLDDAHRAAVRDTEKR